MRVLNTKVAILVLGCLVVLGIVSFSPGSRIGALLPLNALGAGAGNDPAAVKNLTAVIEELRPLHKKLGKPRPGDWLEAHPEPGQTFQEYVRSRPVTPRGERHVLCICPLGDFTPTQRKIITLTADFMSAYFQPSGKD